MHGHVIHFQVLEDIALSAQTQLEANVPFCAFNGGNDVFVDVGNKSLGLAALMTFLGIQVRAKTFNSSLLWKELIF